KAGLWMFTRVLAQELYPHRVSVNELIPGPVRTAITPEHEDQLRAQFGESEWLKSPEDVVPLALFLATQPEVGPTAQSFSLMRLCCTKILANRLFPQLTPITQPVDSSEASPDGS